MIHLENGEIVPVEKSELPIKLPDDVDLSNQILSTITRHGKKLPKNQRENQQFEKQIHWILLLTPLGIF